MKNFVILIFLIAFFSCSTTNKAINSESYTQFEIHKTQITGNINKDIINELRFYKIESSKDAMQLVYQNYGKWNEKFDGKYQANINQIVWRHLKLLNTEETFTVIADGTETMTNYFASLIVYDSNNKDCFDKNHPLREKLTNLFASKMNKLVVNKSLYRLFK